MKIYQYKNEEHYQQAQEAANIRKLNRVWVQQSTIEEIKKRIPSADKILCHGTRNAAEQKYFKKLYPLAEVVGTEISKTASQFPMTVQWDFRKTNKEWLEKFDIVYSNAFDHTNMPQETLEIWKDQLTADGFLVIEHAYTKKDNNMNESDPLEISSEELAELFFNLNLKLMDSFKSFGISKKHISRVSLLKKY